MSLLTLTASYVLLPYAHARAIPHKLVILILNQAGFIDQSLLPSCLQARNAKGLFVEAVAPEQGDEGGEGPGLLIDGDLPESAVSI